MKFKYLKGSEKDFEGAEDGDLYLLRWAIGGKQFATRDVYHVYLFHGAMFDIIAQREPITKSLRESFYCPQGAAEKLGHGLDCEECGPTFYSMKGYGVNYDVKEISAAIDKIRNGESLWFSNYDVNKFMDERKKSIRAKGGPIPPAEPMDVHLAREEEITAIRIQNNTSRPLRMKVTEKDGVTTIDTTITERGTQYGEFSTGSAIMQELKSVMRNTPNWQNLRANQRETLEMIQHKIGRILNGNPDYDDNWRDIAGYATLVLNSLTKANK